MSKLPICECDCMAASLERGGQACGRCGEDGDAAPMSIWMSRWSRFGGARPNHFRVCACVRPHEEACSVLHKRRIAAVVCAYFANQWEASA